MPQKLSVVVATEFECSLNFFTGRAKRPTTKKHAKTRPSCYYVGERVKKAREFKPGRYCAYGGTPSEVPLGTLGTILTTFDGTTRVTVGFDNGTTWNVDKTELEVE